MSKPLIFKAQFAGSDHVCESTVICRGYCVWWCLQLPLILKYKSHLSRQQNCWSHRCSWSIACRRCSNYIFILDLTPDFNGLGKDNCRTMRYWSLVMSWHGNDLRLTDALWEESRGFQGIPLKMLIVRSLKNSCLVSLNKMSNWFQTPGRLLWKCHFDESFITHCTGTSREPSGETLVKNSDISVSVYVTRL